MTLTLGLESSTQMKHLLAFGAIAALGMGVSVAPQRLAPPATPKTADESASSEVSTIAPI